MVAEQLDAVESEPLGIDRRAREGVDGVRYIGLAHRLTHMLPVIESPDGLS